MELVKRDVVLMLLEGKKMKGFSRRLIEIRVVAVLYPGVLNKPEHFAQCPSTRAECL